MPKTLKNIFKSLHVENKDLCIIYDLICIINILNNVVAIN